MRKSPIVEEWKVEGKVEGKREDLLQLLADRFSAGLPGDLVAAVTAETDLKTFSKAIRAVLKASSIGEFRAISGL